MGAQPVPAGCPRSAAVLLAPVPAPAVPVELLVVAVVLVSPWVG
jgi:hypothetical protein